MPRPVGLVPESVHLKISVETKARLRHHSRRLGLEMTKMVHRVVMDAMDQFDALERADADRKRMTRGIRDGNPHRSNWAGGDVPSKIKHSFDRFARVIEEASDARDVETRMRSIKEEIADRVENEAEAAKALQAFGVFMEQRTKATQATKAIAVGGAAKIYGDVD